MPSGEVAAPATRVWPILPSVLSVPVACGVKSPTCLSGTALPVGSIGWAGRYSPAGPLALSVTKIGLPSAPISRACAARGPSG